MVSGTKNISSGALRTQMRYIERRCGLGQQRYLGGPGTCDDQWRSGKNMMKAIETRREINLAKQISRAL